MLAFGSAMSNQLNRGGREDQKKKVAVDRTRSRRGLMDEQGSRARQC